MLSGGVAVVSSEIFRFVEGAWAVANKASVNKRSREAVKR
jgi:hypothetical protein